MPAKKRIAIMLPRFARYGGVEQFGYRLAETLARRGHQVDYICARQSNDAPEGVRVVRKSIVRFPKFIKLLHYARLADKLRAAGAYDCSIGLGKTLNQDIMRVGGGPVVKFWAFSERGYHGWRKVWKVLRRRLSLYHQLDRLLEKERYKRSGKIVAVSYFMRDQALECFPWLTAEDISVIFNRPDLTRFAPPTPEEYRAARQKYGIAANTLAIGHSVQNFEHKGSYPLIRALSLLPAEYHLYVACGRNPEKGQRLARSLGLAERVHFVGKVADMPGYLQAMDLFALPTFHDPCSNSVLEALAAGLPTLSTTANGSSYFLPPEERLEDPNDIAGMAALLRSLGEKALEYRRAGARPAFTWPEDVPAGMDDFADYVEKYLEERAAAGAKKTA